MALVPVELEDYILKRCRLQITFSHMYVFFSQCMTSTSNVQDISMDVTSTGDSCPKNRRRSSGSMSVTSSVSSTRVSYKKEEPAHMCQVITSHWRIQGRRPPPPPRDPILSFLDTFLAKSTRVGRRCPPHPTPNEVGASQREILDPPLFPDGTYMYPQARLVIFFRLN